MLAFYCSTLSTFEHSANILAFCQHSMKHSANMLAYYTASNLEMNLTVAASNLEMHSTVAASISTAGRLATPSTGDTNMIL